MEVIKQMYRNTLNYVRMNDKNSQGFTNKIAVKQLCVFNLLLCGVVAKKRLEKLTFEVEGDKYLRVN